MKTIELVIEQDGKYLERVEFSSESPVTIGRASENSLVLDSSSVSRNHGVLSFNGSQWELEDLKSTNGIELAGEQISKRVVSNNSIISIRPFTIKVILPETKVSEENIDQGLGENDVIIDDGTIMDDATFISDSDATTFGGATYLDSHSVAGNSSEDFLLIQNGRSAGQTTPIFKKTIIGQNSSCDLVLKDSGVAGEHIKIQLVGEKYSFVKLASQASLQLNGKEVVKGRIADGDILKIGDIEVKTRLAGQLTKQGQRKFHGKGTRIALLVTLLVVMIGGTILILKKEPAGVVQDVVLSTGTEQSKIVQKEENKQNSGDGKANKNTQDVTQQQNIVSGEADNLSLDDKRQLTRFVYQAKQYLQAKDYAKAVNRLEAALVVDPENMEVSQLLARSKEQIIEEQREVQLRAEAKEEYKVEAERKLVLVEELLNSGDYTAAVEEIAVLQKGTNEYSDLVEIDRNIKVLKARINKEQSEFRRNIELKKDTFEQQLERAKKDYQDGVKAYQVGNYKEAKKLWESVIKSEINIPERTQANINLDKLNRLLSQKIDMHLKRVNASIQKKDYPTTLFHLNQILTIDPEQSTAKATYEELLPAQLKLAQHYYREGLVYEGINNTKRAIKNWREVLKVLPLEESTYYFKAKKKLTDYGITIK